MNGDGMRPKILTCMKGYGVQQLRKDVFAGCLVAVIAFPLSVALAIASGMSPERGAVLGDCGRIFVSLVWRQPGQYRRRHGSHRHDSLYHCGGIWPCRPCHSKHDGGSFPDRNGFFAVWGAAEIHPKDHNPGVYGGDCHGYFFGSAEGIFWFCDGRCPGEGEDKFIAYAGVFHTAKLQTVAVGILALVILVLLPKVTGKVPGRWQRFWSPRLSWR